MHTERVRQAPEVAGDLGDWRVGFIGLGIMGKPMALRLAQAGTRLIVWNRSPEAVAELVAAGAKPADSPQTVMRSSRLMLMMLRDEAAIDEVLHPDSRELPWLVAGRTIINMGTVSPDYSRRLGERIRAAGGRFVEAPVSGSRRPAELGELVAMVAGADEDVAEVIPLLEPMCSSVTACGRVPDAMNMKLAVNTCLIAVVTGLAESFHVADELGLDRTLLRQILDAGQMSSPISRVKTAKLVDGDFAPQAAIGDVLMNAQLIFDQARRLQIASPILDVCRDLYREAVARGDGANDMVGVVRAIVDRTAVQRTIRRAGGVGKRQQHQLRDR